MRIKLMTLLAGLFLFGNLTIAQSVGEYRIRKTETITKKIEKQKKPKVERENNPEREGLYVMPEVGIIGVDFEFGAYYLNFQGTFGYKFNNHLELGVGLGYYFPGIQRRYYSYIPLYINLRGDITKNQIAKSITPYYSLDFGYNLCVKPMIDDWIFYNEGLLFTPELGIRINNFHIGTAFMITRLHSESMYSIRSNNRVNLVLSLKLGYKIPLKNVKF